MPVGSNRKKLVKRTLRKIRRRWWQIIHRSLWPSRSATNSWEVLPYLDAYSADSDRKVEKGSDIKEKRVNKVQLPYLVSNGLAPEHRLLDIGCGTLRAGRHFIRYLNAGGYTGLELSPKVLDYAVLSVQQAGLSEKRPRLVLNAQKNLRFEQFAGETFDYLLAQSVFTHLPPEHIEECLAHVPSIMHEGSVFFFTFHQGRAYQYDGKKSFMYPASFFTELANRYNQVLRVRDDYPHPKGQKMAMLKLAK